MIFDVSIPISLLILGIFLVLLASKGFELDENKPIISNVIRAVRTKRRIVKVLGFMLMISAGVILFLINKDSILNLTRPKVEVNENQVLSDLISEYHNPRFTMTPETEILRTFKDFKLKEEAERYKDKYIKSPVNEYRQILIQKRGNKYRVIIDIVINK